MLWLAEIGPRVVLKDVEVRPLGSDLFKLTASVENEGYLPTYITRRALAAEVAVPVRVTVELSEAELVVGEWRAEIGHLAGARDARGGAGTAAMRRTIEYVVRASGSDPQVSITVRSEKGGVARQEVRLLAAGG
jgi:hypothetical protein